MLGISTRVRRSRLDTGVGVGSPYKELQASTGGAFYTDYLG